MRAHPHTSTKAATTRTNDEKHDAGGDEQSAQTRHYKCKYTKLSIIDAQELKAVSEMPREDAATSEDVI
jgi:hypothetical protein